ncbi:hypothetical protein BG262_05130 [Floricoccus penangensis]|uniref:HTH marR-type domain-containing protein n=1 Tax=Floricoccus penangensis TaxID=1859475 RepID=A0A9Q5P0J5_9LACT|nr:MarR family transcriptional regulator [Floricoccus penangensis]OFI46400.1 hypothetical protein BG262_05130 [Floricoccus penangensis]
MSKESQDLFRIFMKIIRKPNVAKAVHGINDGRRIRQDGSQRGARGLLFFLNDKSNGLTNSEIAETLDIKPSSVTAMVKQLEQEDLIFRVSDEQDKRINRIYISDEGRKMVSERINIMDTASEELFSSLTIKEQSELLRLLKKLDAANADGSNEFFSMCKSSIFGAPLQKDEK